MERNNFFKKYYFWKFENMGIFLKLFTHHIISTIFVTLLSSASIFFCQFFLLHLVYLRIWRSVQKFHFCLINVYLLTKFLFRYLVNSLCCVIEYYNINIKCLHYLLQIGTNFFVSFFIHIVFILFFKFYFSKIWHYFGVVF